MRTILFTGGLALFSLCCYGQNPEEFIHEGYLVTMDGDTIHGKVKERNAEWADHADVWFMYPDSRIEKVDKNTLSAYSMHNELYVKKKLNPLSTKMVRVLVKGHVTLYEHMMFSFGNSVSNYYLERPGQEKLYLLPETSKKGKIKKYFSDDPVTVAKLKSGEFSISTLPALVRDYNQRH